MNNKIKTFKDVIGEANKAYEEHMNENPSIYSEAGRYHFVLGWLGVAYERLYDECNSKNK